MQEVSARSERREDVQRGERGEDLGLCSGAKICTCELAPVVPRGLPLSPVVSRVLPLFSCFNQNVQISISRVGDTILKVLRGLSY